METKANPVSLSFNVAVAAICNRLFPCGFDVGPDAPDTLEKLNDHVAATGRMKVYDGASDRTIFDSPEHNWMFRAWHDWCHWKHQLPFTPEGERQAALIQQSHLIQLFAGRDDLPLWLKLVDIEVNGQVEHFEQTGAFPEDQRAFTLARLAA